MHYAQTLQALRAYTPSHTEDADFQQRMLAFVSQYPERFHQRTTEEGHLTASVWIMNAAGDRFLLTHHAKLNRWLQLGGHIEDDDTLRAAALREAREESGLQSVRLYRPDIFDLDIHTIPARKGEAEHLHLDVRFLCVADDTEPFTVTAESHALAWVSAEELRTSLPEASMQHMLMKTPTS